ELDLKNFLKDKLPAYMIPKKFIKVEQFALNANGKIDRKVLSGV
ncbi:D-alanine--poly(phosphoribitol) ligase, partial [Campylobacter sp. P255]